MPHPRTPTWCALDRSILAAADYGPNGNWCAFIGVVPGKNHDDEYKAVLDSGTKLNEPIARALFPQFSDEHEYGF